MERVLDPDAVTQVRDSVLALAREIPTSVTGLTGSTGSTEVDAALGAYVDALRARFAEATRALDALGRSAGASADALVAADRRLAAR